MNIGAHFLHLFDFLSDSFLAWRMYSIGYNGNNSKIKTKKDINTHYHIAFIWIFMSQAGPFIIQYSSMINSFYLKGYF